jgi:pimeloyl-ACP methyl ester carboxylesterase
MRKSVRVVFLTFLALLTSTALSVASAFVASLALAATALIVPGTGTPNADVVALYREHAADRYIAPFNPSCTSTNGCNLNGVPYPASFFPLGFIGNWCPGYKCDTWNASVGAGVDNTITALQDLTDPDGAILFGYSQGGAVVSDALRKLEGNSLLDKVTSVVLIGNAYNPDGGLFTRLGFLPTIPFLNISFGPATPVDTGVPMTSIGFEYDPVMYAPEYWGNPFAMLNALAAFETVHGNYLTPNGNDPTAPIAYGYTDSELGDILAEPCPGPHCRVDSQGNKYYMIPAKSLPIMDLVSSVIPAPLQPVAKPVIDLVSPVYKVLADLGYDWSGDPGKEKWLSILPFNPIQNWPAVGVKLVVATVQGVQAFIGDLGGLTSAITPLKSETTTPVSTLALRSTATEDTAAKADVKKADVKKDVQKDNPTTSDEPSATTPEDTTKVDDPKADDTATPAAADTKDAETKASGKTDDKKATDRKAGKAGDKKAGDKKAGEKKDGEKKDGEKKATDKTETDTTSDNETKPETDKKDADSAKAAA